MAIWCNWFLTWQAFNLQSSSSSLGIATNICSRRLTVFKIHISQICNVVSTTTGSTNMGESSNGLGYLVPTQKIRVQILILSKFRCYPPSRWLNLFNTKR